MARAAVTAVVRSPGRLVDPVPVLRAATASSVVGSFREWVNGVRWKFKTYRETSAVVQAFPDFHAREFQSDVAPDVFRSFLDVYSSGRVGDLEDVCTPSFAARAAAALRTERAATGGVHGAEAVSALAAPEVTSVRTWRRDALSVTPGDPDVAQVCVRMTWRLYPVFTPLDAEATLAGRVAGGAAKPAALGPGKGKRKRKQRAVRIVASAKAVSPRRDAPQPVLGSWLPAVDPSSGRVFYFNDASGQVAWEAPGAVGLVEPGRPLRVEDIGTEVEPFEGVAPPGAEGAALAAAAKQDGAEGVGDDAGSERPSFRVTTHVTLERVFPSHEPGPREAKWRIAGLL